VHFGRNAESMRAPDVPRSFPLKSASVMEVFIVTGFQLVPSPLKVNTDIVPISLVWFMDISANKRQVSNIDMFGHNCTLS
jgi:hypothetical protein